MTEGDKQTTDTQGETQSQIRATEGTQYGPALAHAACIAPPFVLYFFGVELFGSAPAGFAVGIVVMLGCWAAILYARAVALKGDSPDTYAAFQYKQAVVFAAASVGVMVILAATIILALVAVVVWLIVIGYSLYGAYRVFKGEEFRYAIIGKRLST